MGRTTLKKKQKKRNKDKKHYVRGLAYWKVNLQKVTNPYQILYRIKTGISPPQMREIVEWLQSTPLLSQRILGTKFPRNSEEWGGTPIAGTTSYDRETQWCCARLLSHVADIAEFVKFSEDYDLLFVRGDYEGCLVHLDSVEERFGLSLWLAKRKIHVLQLAKGLEEQKAYASLLNDDPLFKYGIIPYIIYSVSYRAEEKVSPQRFIAQLQHLLFKISDPFHSYLRYHILMGYCEDESIQAGILNYESAGSLLDYYEALVSTSQMNAAKDDGHILDNTLEILQELGKATKDKRLLRVIAQHRYKQDILTPAFICSKINVFEEFIGGKNASVITNVSKSLENSTYFEPGDFLLFILASLDPSIDADQGAQYSIYPMVGRLREMLSGEGTSKTTRDVLHRYAWALDGSAISHLLRSAILSEDNPIPEKSDSTERLYSLISMGNYHPIQSWWSTSLQSMYKSIYSGNRNSAITTTENLFTKEIDLENSLEHLNNEYGNWEKARQCIRKGAYAQAHNYSQRFADSGHPFYRKQSMLFTITCFMELGKIDDCLEIATNFWMLYPHSSKSLPLIQLMEVIKNEMVTAIAGNISYPIFCHAFTIFTEEGENFRRSYAAEDFLASLNLSRPSELRDTIEIYPPNKLLLFLHEICVEQVMDTWIEFSSSEEVAFERVEVCKLLADLYPENNDVYQGEIRDIMRRLTVRKRITEVEQSKIYVDTEGVKEVAKRTLSEDYERYLSFRRSGMMSRAYKEALEKANLNLLSGFVEELLNLNFPRNEMSALLEEMVLHLRDEFVSSRQHGLDGYLSVRIRHGTLEGQLRSPFESENLLTKKSAESEKYGPNLYWMERLAYKGSNEEEANKAFREFSSQFDQLVHNVNQNWIQIKKNPEDRGHIDFTLRSTEIDLIAAYITEETTLDEFIDYVLDYFVSEKLDLNLEKMRHGIQTEIKTKLNDLVTELQTSIEGIGSSLRIEELRSAIGRARSFGQNTLDRIANWLRLAKTETKEPFLLDEVISISESSVQASCPEFSITRNIDAYLGELLINSGLPSFVDVVCLIFDNIIRRSGLADLPKGIVNAKYEEPYLCIRVENEVAPEVATDAKRRRVDEIRDDIQSQLFSQSVSKEGGTGFLKVQKILNHDFQLPTVNLKPLLSFGFEGDNQFYVDVKIPTLLKNI